MDIIEAKKKSCSCIYRINFPNGKVYIGKTKDLGSRIKLYERNVSIGDKSSKVIDAIKEFGFDSLTIDILSEPKNISKDDLEVVLSILEIKHIRSNNSIFPNGYNISIGGEILGIPIDCITTDAVNSCYSGGNKHVLVYDLEGNFVAEFDSIEKCAYHFGVDSSVVSSNLDRRRELFYDKYMLRQKRYGKIPEKILPFKKEVIEKKVINTIYEDRIIYRDKLVSCPKNTILKYNSDGVFCGEYDTLTDAAISIGRRNVSKGILTAGYIFFEHDGGEIQQNIGKIEKRNVRLPRYSDFLNGDKGDVLNYDSRRWSSLINDFKIAQYSRDGILLNVYNSINEASYSTGIRYSSIWSCVFGRTKIGGGYIWRRYEEK